MDLSTIPGLDGPQQNAHRDILARRFATSPDPPYQPSGIEHCLNQGDPMLLDPDKLEAESPSTLTLVKNKQIAFGYMHIDTDRYADICPKTAICTIYKNFWAPHRRTSFVGLDISEGAKLDDLRYGLSSVTIVHEGLHSPASILADDAQIAVTDVPNGFELLIPPASSSRYRKGNLEFMMQKFEDCLMYVKRNAQDGTKHILKSAVNFHYLVVLILLFCCFPRYKFTSGVAVLRKTPAHTDTLFRPLDGKKRDSPSSDAHDDDPSWVQNLSDEQKRARDNLIWMIERLT
ncbi:hypothetical protein OHC33_005051 [Knufia fluminis]|uniref:Uncharacterized protein n=1 Tax=Knufia fluminis TaxID=191047 RepID=A0AAN8IN22_9EURO|nr:hypothetical protein OHC33_005051 [Knufia fluminis]